MLYFTRLKTTLIVLFCAIGVLLTLPNLVKRPVPGIPWPQIHLGLDLRGGSYLLMQIDMNAVVKEQLANLTDEVRHTLLQADIGYTDLGGDVAAQRVQFNLVKPADAAKVRQLLAKLVSPVAAAGGVPDLDVKVTDAGATTLTLSRPALIAKQTQAIAQSITIIGRRIDGSGVVDPQIARQGADQIVIQLPGVSDPNQIKALLGKTAHMTFHMVAEDVNPETKVPPPGV
ncbi:MAG TPA: protein translocase subunit SecD, partial [Acidiphilium sp.]|nr:protein translocase subunit SecD [Acidiphilium sp.]